MEYTDGKNIIMAKSLSFAIKITHYYLDLKQKQYFDIARQLFKSGTSIGANIREA